MSELKNPVAGKDVSSRNATAVEVDILVVIDTDYVMEHYPNPSQDPNNPTAIDHNSEFMICTGARKIISGQGTADLNFQAAPGDTVDFRGTSIYDNSDSAVIIYGVQKYSGDSVFNPFNNITITRTGAVMPNPNSSNGLPAVQQKISFNAYQSTVSNSGTENFRLYFALYTLDNNGENQNLFGYYAWDPTITVA